MSSQVILVFALLSLYIVTKVAKEGYTTPKKKTKIYKKKKPYDEKAMWAKTLALIPDVAPAMPAMPAMPAAAPATVAPLTMTASTPVMTAPATVDTTDYSYVDPFGKFQDRSYYEGRV